MLRLAAQQSMTLQVKTEPISLSHYLKQPQRLIHALMHPQQVETLGTSCFRFHLKGIQFLVLHVKPVVDLQVDVTQPNVLRVRSVNCQIPDNDFVNEHFHLALVGTLQLQEAGTITQVRGQADLAIAVDLPPVLQLTPTPFLEATGNQILKGVLLTMKQRLLRQLAADYQRWNAQQGEIAAPTTAAACLPNT
jgi:hypothetical protein